MSVLTDLIYGGSNAVAGLTEGAVNDAIAKYGADKAIAFPDTAYFFPTIYAATGVKVKTLGDLVACVGVLKEPFTMEEGLAERPLEQYIKNVIENNGHTNIEPQNKDGLWYYVNYNNSSYRCVYSYAYKGTDAFYVVQYIINTVDEETLKPVIHEWAKATSVK